MSAAPRRRAREQGPDYPEGARVVYTRRVNGQPVPSTDPDDVGTVEDTSLSTYGWRYRVRWDSGVLAWLGARYLSRGPEDA